MTQVFRTFICRRCNARATLEELTEFMSVIECPQCEVSEILDHEDLGTLDHFSFFDVPVPLGEWKN